MLRGIVYFAALFWLGDKLVTGAQTQNWWVLAATCVVGAGLTSYKNFWLGHDKNTTGT